MAKPTYTTRNAYRAIERIAEERAERIAQEIVDHIHVNAPYDPEHDDGGPHLRDSFYWRRDAATGDVLVMSRRRYWAFVEFGTKEHGGPQRYIRNAIEYARARHR